MMKTSLYLIGLLLLAACSSAQPPKEAEAAKPAYVQMADSEMKRTPDPRLLDFRDKPKWEYTNGLMLLAFYEVWGKTHDQRYLDYGKSYMDSMITADGNIRTYKLTDYNIDRVSPGRFLILLNQQSPDPKYEAAIQTLRDQMRTHPRTAEGGFWHKLKYEHQMWLDGLYMGSPFLAEYAAVYKDSALFDQVVLQFLLIDKHSYDPATGLYYHGWDESKSQKWANPETGQSPEFWGRAMGWFAMAAVDVLDYLPADHPKRDSLIHIVQKVAAGLARYQDPTRGVWYQVMDKAGTEGNYPEASCSGMFTYFLAKSLNKGYIDPSYRTTADLAWRGLTDVFTLQKEDGTLSLIQVCAVAGLGGEPYRDGSYDYYIHEQIRDDDPKGVAPFIMASLQMEQLQASTK